MRKCSGLPCHSTKRRSTLKDRAGPWPSSCSIDLPEKFRFLSSQLWTFAMAPVVHQTLHLGHMLVIIATQYPPDAGLPICHCMPLFDIHKRQTPCVSQTSKKSSFTLVLTCPHIRTRRLFTNFLSSSWTASYRLFIPALGLLPRSQWSRAPGSASVSLLWTICQFFAFRVPGLLFSGSQEKM